MNRKEIIVDIENKLRNLNSYDDSELKILKDYYDLTLIDGEKNQISVELQAKVNKVYEAKIEKEKKNNSSYVDFSKIKVIISTLGLSKISKEILEELPFEKTMRICENVKNIYLFHTEEASKNFSQIKEKLLSKKAELLINENIPEEKVITKENIMDIRSFLFEVVKNLKNQGIKEDEILIDLTAGFKLASVAMYRIAVENGIKVINWKELYFSMYKKISDDEYEKSERSTRIVFSTSLEILKEVLEENKQILLDINEALERKEYKTVSNFYKRLDRKDEEKFFKEVSAIFNQEIFITFNLKSFSINLKKFVDEILTYRNFSKSFKEKIKNLMLYLKVVSDFSIENKEANKEFIEKLSKEYDAFKIKNEEEDEKENFYTFFCEHYVNELKNLDIKKEDIENFWFDFIYVFKEEDDEDHIILEGLLLEGLSKENLFTYLVGINYVEKLENRVLFKIQEKSIIKDLFEKEDLENYYINKLFGKNEEIFVKVEELIGFEYLKEESRNTINFKDNVLRIEKYDITIDFVKEKINLTSFAKDIINTMLVEKKYNLTEKDLKEINGDNSEKTLNKNKTNFKNGILKQINEAVMRKMNNINHFNIEKEDFIQVTPKKIKSNYVYKINKNFY